MATDGDGYRVDGTGSASGMGRASSSEPTFSAALSVWRGK